MEEIKSKGYMIAPLGLTERQLLIYQKLYEKCDFRDMTVSYTTEQLACDIKCVNLTNKMVNTDLKDFIKKGILIRLKRGVNGKPSLFQIVKYIDLTGNLSVTYKGLKGNLKHSNSNDLNDVEVTNRELIGKLKVNPIKEKEKDNNIYSLIFDYWISKEIKKHRQITSDIKKAIDKTLKEYTQEEILQAINNYGTMYNDKNYTRCTYQWGLNEFLLRKDKDGIRQLGMFLDDGSKYLYYLKCKNEDIIKSKTIDEELDDIC